MTTPLAPAGPPSFRVDVYQQTGQLAVSGLKAEHIVGLTVIHIDRATGQVQITGPIQDRILIMGLLTTAIQVVQEWHQKQSGQRLVQPPGSFRLDNHGPA